MDKYLPIGSIVLLKEGKKRIMIYDVKQTDSLTNIEYDYVACLFPEGNLDKEHTYLFNHDQIEKIFFIGLQDSDELNFNDYLHKIDSEITS